jgi:uncharacterized protein (TIGR03083 family)
MWRPAAGPVSAHTMAAVVPGMIMGAFDAESRRLSEIAAGTDDAAFARPSPCLPWTAGELLYHVQMTMERLGVMLAAPEPAGSALVTAPGYYRADRRFSAAVNADRIGSAQRGAAAVPGAAARARDFSLARERIWSLLQSVPPERVVRTRHGDRMLLTEFLRTRVLELAVHGLDLAVALDRRPWMTVAAAEVTEELLLASSAAARLRAAAGWDRVTLIAKLTGRVPAAAAETRLIDSLGIQRLALG